MWQTSRPPNHINSTSIQTLLVNRASIFCTVDSAVSYINVHWKFIGDFFKLLSCENKLQGLYFYFFPTVDFVQKIIYQEFIVSRSKTIIQGVCISNFHAWKNRKQNKQKKNTVSIQKRQDVKYLPTVTKIATWIN